MVGKWWYQPGDARSFCGSNVTKPFCHASFYSLGSICCGSLLVGPVRLVRQFTAFFRPSNDVNTLMCMQQCLHCAQSCVTTCIDYVADGLNPWAFTYVGLYGYGFIDAGRHATELFKKREWTMIISDDILPNILLMMSLVIGGITGCFAFLIENLDFLKIAKKEDLGTLTFRYVEPNCLTIRTQRRSAHSFCIGVVILSQSRASGRFGGDECAIWHD